MKRSRFTEEQITYALRQHEAGTAVEDVCRQLGVSQATFYNWKKKYAHMGVSELRELRQPRDGQQGRGTSEAEAPGGGSDAGQADFVRCR